MPPVRQRPRPRPPPPNKQVDSAQPIIPRKSKPPAASSDKEKGEVKYNVLTYQHRYGSQFLIETKAGHMAMSPEFWKFIVLLIPMIAVTFVLVFVFQMIWARKRHEAEESIKMEEAGDIVGV
ncbi:hypothetical protein PT974_07536 [Cladobotryum mycophilum]|uniref:Uncharacterized protein n=1 Tax=Cladobotryum mycophilum TaxID=491253 RepID=A0ABR0SQQ7_9HYPO